MNENLISQEQQTEDLEFAQWAIIQLMGHVTYSGYVESVTVFGKPMVKLTIPEISGERSIPSFTKFISPNSLYDVTPVDEDFAVKMAARLRKAPVENYAHNEVIKEMAKDYVKKMEASEVAQILLNQKNENLAIEEESLNF
jgi:hypothetical protein